MRGEFPCLCEVWRRVGLQIADLWREDKGIGMRVRLWNHIPYADRRAPPIYTFDDGRVAADQKILPYKLPGGVRRHPSGNVVGLFMRRSLYGDDKLILSNEYYYDRGAVCAACEVRVVQFVLAWSKAGQLSVSADIAGIVLAYYDAHQRDKSVRGSHAVDRHDNTLEFYDDCVPEVQPWIKDRYGTVERRAPFPLEWFSPENAALYRHTMYESHEVLQRHRVDDVRLGFPHGKYLFERGLSFFR